MVGQKFRDLAVLFAVGITLRLLFIPLVGVWGDMGFYGINSRLILEGQRPFIDFIGRSPTAIYLFAAVRAVATDVPVAFRLTLNALWALTALPVYGIARKALDHEAGLVAAAVMLLTPFSLVYGQWTNTQPQAMLPAMIALWVIVRYRSVRAHWLAGGLFGLAFLARRSVLPIAGFAAVYIAWTAYQNDQSAGQIAASWLGMGLAGTGVLGVAYLLLAQFHIGTALALADIHAVSLFLSEGRGGYAMLTDQAVPSRTRRLNSGRVPIFNDVCQLCSAWTARTFAKTTFIALPGILVGWAYFRDLTRNYMTENGVRYMFGILILLGLYALGQTVIAGRWIRSLAILLIALSGVLVYQIEPIQHETLYKYETGLIVGSGMLLAVAYLYRNRILHTYYFMDFWPLLAVVAGVVGVLLWRRAEEPERYAMAGIVVLSMFTGLASAYPLTNMLTGNEGGWHDIDSAQKASEDFDARGDEVVVLTANPVYMGSAHEARVWQDNARIHHVTNSFGDEGPGARVFDDLAPALRRGEIDYVVYSNFARNVINVDPAVTRAFRENYCRTDGGDVYEQTDATLYEYCG